jgi:predicted NBD/HSP70 family sugar kinase
MGCLETEASMKVLVEKVRQGLASGRVSSIKNLSADTDEAFHGIVQAAVRGDQLAVELLTEMVHTIGKGIAILVHIMNPEEIVISGRGAAAGKLLLPPLQQALNRYCIPRLTAHTQLRISDLNKEAELFGAAALVVEHLDKRFITNRTSPQNHPFAA